VEKPDLSAAHCTLTC